jgi:D-alanyl-D-alanine carboxypeptidase/D-alanyl-D-alanine-endopeptidase (penicillin-binding protein 4)
MPGAGHGAEPAPIVKIADMDRSGIMIDAGPKLKLGHHPDIPMIPASTLKILTGLAAIEHWGLDHHFSTRFYLDDENRLWIEGRGDPSLDTEELDRIVAGLTAAGVHQIRGVGADGSYFSQYTEIPGRTPDSWAAYDAPVTALAFNYNSVALTVNGDKVTSFEKETPLTPTAIAIGKTPEVGKNSFRASVRTPQAALQQAGELVFARLDASEIDTTGNVIQGKIPTGAQLVYTHVSRKSLGDIVMLMLKYSNNVIANTLFLKMSDQKNGWPIDTDSARRHMMAWARRRFGWNSVTIEEGAGLSRGNAITPRQMINVVKAFAPYRDLLKVQRDDERVKAKTGGLKGVYTYAGFSKRGLDWVPFSVMINEQVESRYLLFQVASQIADSSSLMELCQTLDCETGAMTTDAPPNTIGP